jgi:hypothetical protein
MTLGPSVSEAQVIQVLCSTGNSTLPTLENASQLAAAYYGWNFASDPAFKQWPFYPSVQTHECG